MSSAQTSSTWGKGCEQSEVGNFDAGPRARLASIRSARDSMFLGRIDGLDLEFVARGDAKLRVVGEHIEHTEVIGWVRFAQIR